jgi:hypothetical protein
LLLLFKLVYRKTATPGVNPGVFICIELCALLGRPRRRYYELSSTFGTKLNTANFRKTLQSGAETPRIRTLFIAESKEQLQEQLGEVHSQNFLPKPYTREQLAITVQKNLKH